MTTDKRLAMVLLFQRLTVFLVMFLWSVDKPLRPEHASLDFGNFYFIKGLVPLPV